MTVERSAHLARSCAPLLVQAYASVVAMRPVPPAGRLPSRQQLIEDLPWLDEAVLRSSRSRQRGWTPEAA